ncbi:MAG: HAD family hydrolase [Gammaproteobacteria bacterium]|nr:MAG: HAD family hydrolase [Gammaproteobacteria bacterium]
MPPAGHLRAGGGRVRLPGPRRPGVRPGDHEHHRGLRHGLPRELVPRPSPRRSRPAGDHGPLSRRGVAAWAPLPALRGAARVDRPDRAGIRGPHGPRPPLPGLRRAALRRGGAGPGVRGLGAGGAHRLRAPRRAPPAHRAAAAGRLERGPQRSPSALSEAPGQRRPPAQPGSGGGPSRPGGLRPRPASSLPAYPGRQGPAGPRGCRAGPLRLPGPGAFVVVAHMTPELRTRLIARIRALSRPLVPRPTALAFRPPERPLRTRTLVFDLYGTLLISASGDVGTTAEDDVRALADALASTGLEAPARALVDALHAAILEHHRHARERLGIAYPEIDIRTCWAAAFQAVTGTIPPQVQLERLAVEYECRINPVWPMPGADVLLAELSQAGIRLGILSNAQFYTPLVLEALFGKSVAQLGFDPALCLWSWETGHGKPSDWLFAELDRRLAPGERPLYVGNDMLKDIAPAARIGWHTALFAGDARSLRLREDDPRVRGIEPDAVLTELLQIKKIIV